MLVAAPRCVDVRACAATASLLRCAATARGSNTSSLSVGRSLVDRSARRSPRRDGRFRGWSRGVCRECSNSSIRRARSSASPSVSQAAPNTALHDDSCCLLCACSNSPRSTRISRGCSAENSADPYASRSARLLPADADFCRSRFRLLSRGLRQISLLRGSLSRAQRRQHESSCSARCSARLADAW